MGVFYVAAIRIETDDVLGLLGGHLRLLICSGMRHAHSD